MNNGVRSRPRSCFDTCDFGTLDLADSDGTVPERFHGPPSVKTKAAAGGKTKTKAKAASTKSKQREAAPSPGAQPLRISGAWWALPIGLLSLIILAPLAFLLIVWIRNRREHRRALRSYGH